MQCQSGHDVASRFPNYSLRLPLGFVSLGGDFGSEVFDAEESVEADLAGLLSDLDSLDFVSGLLSVFDAEEVDSEVFDSEAADFL
jgi:hypothetical protein